MYDTLEEHIKCGKTWFPVAELSERLKSKARKDPISKMNEYQKEYAQICKQTPRYVAHPVSIRLCALNTECTFQFPVFSILYSCTQ